jgi:uncharacterized membrane protein YbhN (UPF0104 family)
VATGAFVSILLPGALVAPFTLVYRSLIVYGPAAAGAFFLLGALKGQRARETPSRPRAAACLGLD